MTFQERCDLVASALRAPEPAGFSPASRSIPRVDSDDAFLERLADRTARALTSWEVRPSDLDRAVLLRGFLRAERSAPLAVPSPAISPALERALERCSVETRRESSGRAVIQAKGWSLPGRSGPQPGTLDGAPLRCRHDPPASGDGWLRGAFMNDYASIAQKAAIHAVAAAPPGGTLLVNLPTGGGKSLCALFLALEEGPGTVLVVTPTIALALDQERAACRLLGERAGKCAYTSIASLAERREMRERLAAGTLPVLFAGPEMVAHGDLTEPLLEAAARSGASALRAFALDEAHLVEAWGVSFRPEFQRLAEYRRALLRRAARHGFPTLLLSATISSTCRDLLRRLFAGPAPFASVEAPRLRPETEYAIVRDLGDDELIPLAIQAIRHLPRPAIVYVNEVAEAEAFADALSSEGLARHDVFTGETQGPDRNRIVDQWRQDELDLVVATSAFGLGVDKPDVRAIVHLGMPDDVDRWYQEVGRGGRDGYAALALLLARRSDPPRRKVAMQRHGIGVEKAAPRWTRMRDSSRPVASGSRFRAVSLESVPPLLAANSDVNQFWNHNVLLALERAGVLRFAEDAVAPQERDGLTCTVEILDADAANRDDRFQEAYHRGRLEEVAERGRRFDGMVDVVRSAGRTCTGEVLARSFERGTDERRSTLIRHACGGCDACRASSHPTVAGTLEPVCVEWAGPSQRSLGAALATALGPARHLMLLGESAPSADRSETVAAIEFLIADGVTQLVVADEEEEPLREALEARANVGRYGILPFSWWVDVARPSQPVATALILGGETQERSDKVFASAERRVLGRGVPLVTLAAYDLRLPSHAGGRFMDRVDGSRLSTAQWIARREERD